VYGDLGSGWRKDALAAGPIAFLGLGAPAADLAPVEGKYRGLKVLAVVDQGMEVTVSISPPDVGHVALLYDQSAFRDDGLYALSDGDRAVTFQACAEGESPFKRFGVADGPTQFNGGFIVDGPRCVTLEVASSGSLKQISISFGVGRCGGSS